ncbi:hypothetical protein MNBD_GAMMA25-2382 [hydrothermal vent metagenome]|uniref:Anti sigma-E protein RseA N-terminal domain-containing protein n=1 Tax=hydrothermal vent metagenome TaxID=652676 RepID=A0A3B1BBM8_9ZZZZ
MSETREERLSALMDDELIDYQQDLDKLEQSDELKQRWMRYHLIRDVVSGHLPDTVVPDFNLASRVSAAIEHEPTILAPRRFQPRQLMKQAAGLAIAATVSAIAIISIQNPNLNQIDVAPLATVDKPVENVLAFAPSGKQRQVPSLVSLPASTSANGAAVMLTSSNPTHVHRLTKNLTSPSKFSGYLLNHNEYSVSSNMQGMLPYMRIVGKTQNQPVIIRIANEK